MTAMVKVKFNKNYIASRGPGIVGHEGQERSYRMTDELKALIDEGVCDLVKETKAAKRKKAAGKKGGETS